MTPVAVLGTLALSLVIVLGQCPVVVTIWSASWRVALVFCGLHVMSAFAVLVSAALTGVRRVTLITIRPDGLLLGDRHFFPARHILSISFGTTHNRGKPEEQDVPRLEIDFGTRRVLLAEDLHVPSAQLFERLFREDSRRYWHRHN